MTRYLAIIVAALTISIASISLAIKAEHCGSTWHHSDKSVARIPWEMTTP